ncbi:ribonuclease T2 [Parachitinimonas caeni]|uniref:Ribonuclease T2 n=1 Tax=Parachitinimonas caeni TaxID=3031301 RepID=A0ABT7DYQ6_9NEIS|nr:ribonuclease T2 [Parachitinimonas caeni]MDK2124193.1 ribonuclease T2 [Parachitinimonas caeni]
MKLKSKTILFAGLAIFSSFQAVKADSFDYYLFAASWQPGFCATHADKAECQTLTSSSWTASHMSLHGLWPNRYGGNHPAYCGVSSQVVGMDKNNSQWCQMGDYGLSSSFRQSLAQQMPGVDSCLDYHEWYKHGSCAGQAPVDYFATAQWLTQQLGGTSFNQFLVTNRGRTVSRNALLNAFDASFGSNARRAVSLKCTKSGGVSYFAEAWIALNADTLDQFPSASSLVMDAGQAGNCPSSNIYIARF